MSCGEFTDDEIRHELAQLGYHNVPDNKLEEFKKDLITLISRERSKSNSLNSSGTSEPGEDKTSHYHQHINSGFEADESFNNHARGSQWIGQSRFNEDWKYQGQRPQTAPEGRGRNYYDVEHHQPSSLLHQERNQSCLSDDISETCSENRYMKRKTSRKTPNGCRLVDESFTDTDSGVFEIYEKIKNLAMRECECGKTRSKTGDVEPPYRMKNKVNKYPSVIKKRIEPPHTRNLVKTNINDRHQMYKQAWKTQPPIGDDHRIPLRKAVHAQLLRRDEVKLKQKVYIPNFYVPPHEKLRKDVRWRVRQACENYELPNHGYYHEI